MGRIRPRSIAIRASFAAAACAWIAAVDQHQVDAIRMHCRRSQTARETARAVLSRRRLMATAIGGGAAWLIGGASLLVSYRSRVGAMHGSSMLTALWAELGYPRAIGEACLKALPAADASKECLTRAVFGDVLDAGRDRWSARAIVQSIRERSREDFRDGRIVVVDGWMLSLTETRVYALAALMPSQRETVD